MEEHEKKSSESCLLCKEMKQSKDQVEAYKLVGKINGGINKFMNAKLKQLCELDSSDDDDYGKNITHYAENKLI